MYKCTGQCSTCGKCQSDNIIQRVNDRKVGMFHYPPDFHPEKNKQGYGIAFDIGTTTVVGILWNLNKGQQLAAKVKTNAQIEYGSDVISRITFIMQYENNLQILRDKIIDTLNEVINDLCAEIKIKNQDIKSIVLCGNSVMSHIIGGYSPLTLAHSPFLMAYTGYLTLNQWETMLNIDKDGIITVLPGIGGHVGGDMVAGITATRFLDSKSLSVYVDIGTNGEIAVTDQGKTYACSTSAGPAFEGASIKWGIRAVSGAIERIEITRKEVNISVIDSCEPTGICGSGLIDALAEMIKAGLIDKTGRLIAADEAIKKGIDPELTSRLETVDDIRQFIIVYSENGSNIVLTQNDIREVQLAKGAIAAGIKILLNKINRTKNDIGKIIVAGAFGNYIDKGSAKIIGLLPNITDEKILFVGNAAGAGVSMALASEKEMKTTLNIPSQIQHVELADCDEFQNFFLRFMDFSNFDI